MSIQGEIDRINNNVSDALAAAAEMGASVPETANSNDLGRLIRSIPQSGGGGTSINVTAEVGQTIVVKAVDENGKPTAWESADYQPRTHWMERVELLPETTVEIDPDEGFGAIPVGFAIEAGEPYTIKYNGVEYADCVGVENEEGAVAFGNLFALDQSSPSTEHPFVMLFVAMDMDGDGNIDYVVGVFSLDGSETVTLSIAEEVIHKLDGKFLPQGTPYLEPFDDVILEETVLSDVIVDKSGGFGLLNLPLQNSIVVGNIYEVSIGNSTYSLKAYPVIDDENCYAALGSGCVIPPNYVPCTTTGMPYNNAPFVLQFLNPAVAQQNGYNAMIAYTSNEDPGRMTIRGVYKPNKIDDNCLPDISMPLVVTVTVGVEANEYVPSCTWAEAYCAAENGRFVFLVDGPDVYSLSRKNVVEMNFGRVFMDSNDNFKLGAVTWSLEDGITLTSKTISP